MRILFLFLKINKTNIKTDEKDNVNSRGAYRTDCWRVDSEETPKLENNLDSNEKNDDLLISPTHSLMDTAQIIYTIISPATRKTR